MATKPGLKAVDLFRQVREGRVKALWIMATNPAVSMPDAGFVREALARCETLVVSDVIADTDTARLAHVRLPALAWGEKDGTVTNSERLVSRQRALFAAPGEARADWAIMADVGRRLGHGAAFAYGTAGQIFREYAAMTALAVKRGKLLDLTEFAGIDSAQYDALEPFQWGGRHPLAAATVRPRLVAVAPTQVAIDPDFPLRLNTGRYRDQWHTMTRTGLSPTLSQHRREPVLAVHPRDAAAAGLDNGGLARVVTPQGAALFRVALDDGQRPGEIFVPMHWSDTLAGEGRANRLPPQVVDPVSGQPAFKNSAARVEPVTPEWRAFLVSVEDAPLTGLQWWTRSRVAGGWLHELAGDGTIDEAALLPAGERIEVSDLVRGMRRVAVRDDTGRLLAALFVTRSGTLPARDWAAGQLGLAEASVPELLAGRPSIPAPDRGPIVCVCHGIGEFEIAGCGARTVAEAGSTTRAGTNCGSCRPAIARLLAAQITMEAAA